jgi:DNA polymerase III alpha subunit
VDIALPSDLSTTLQHRILWYDGSNSFEPGEIIQNINIPHSFVTELSDQVKQFNRFVPEHKKLSVKQTVNMPVIKWDLPETYIDEDIENYIIDCFEQHTKTINDVDLYESRLVEELTLFKRLNLYDLLKVMHYITDTLNAHNIVWGLGRGSSVASYVLFLLDVHNIDPVLYDIDFSEFIN